MACAGVGVAATGVAFFFIQNDGFLKSDLSFGLPPICHASLYFSKNPIAGADGFR